MVRRWRGTLTQPFAVKLFRGIWNAHPRFATRTVMVKNNDVDSAFSLLNRHWTREISDGEYYKNHNNIVEICLSDVVPKFYPESEHCSYMPRNGEPSQETPFNDYQNDCLASPRLCKGSYDSNKYQKTSNFGVIGQHELARVIGIYRLTFELAKRGREAIKEYFEKQTKMARLPWYDCFLKANSERQSRSILSLCQVSR